MWFVLLSYTVVFKTPEVEYKKYHRMFKHILVVFCISTNNILFIDLGYKQCSDLIPCEIVLGEKALLFDNDEDIIIHLLYCSELFIEYCNILHTLNPTPIISYIS